MILYAICGQQAVACILFHYLIHVLGVVFADGLRHGNYSDSEDVGAESDLDDVACLEFESRFGYLAVDFYSALLACVLGYCASLDYS